MSTRIENLERRLRELEEISESTLASNRAIWVQLAQDYNVPSYVLESFYQSAFKTGADCQEKIDTLANLELEKARLRHRLTSILHKD
jgi:hypothetical protein